jgi:hypothetical protein
MPSGELLRHGADASATRSFAISTSCPSPTQTTQERGRATAGKYVLVNPDRVNWGAGGRRAVNLPWSTPRCLLARR